jgi:cardiolipin synthase
MIFLRQARKSIWIANAYFVPGPPLVRVLSKAAQRGVEVHILLPGLTDQPFVQAAGRHCFGKLLQAGVHIAERQGRMLHAKIAVVDGAWVIMGSANLDPRSFRHNLELNVALSHPDLGLQVQRILSHHHEESIPVNPVLWPLRPWPARLWSQFAYFFRWWL